MIRYNYFAKSLDGTEKKGVIEAENISSLAHILRQDGYILVHAEPEGAKKKSI